MKTERLWSGGRGERGSGFRPFCCSRCQQAFLSRYLLRTRTVQRNDPEGGGGASIVGSITQQSTRIYATGQGQTLQCYEYERMHTRTRLEYLSIGNCTLRCRNRNRCGSRILVPRNDLACSYSLCDIPIYDVTHCVTLNRVRLL